MPTEPDRPPIVPSPIDPDVECVRVDTLTLPGGRAKPPDPPLAQGDESPSLCPDGYVPRRRQRRDYRLDGKVVVTGTPPTRNPDNQAETKSD